MIKKLRVWLIMLLINKKPFVANVDLIETLAVDIDRCGDGDYINIKVRKNHNQKIPDAAFYFATGVEYI